MRSRLAAIGPSLEQRERAVLAERLLSDEPVRLRDLGQRFAVSGEAMRQVEQRLLSRLRASLEPTALAGLATRPEPPRAAA